MNRNDWEKGRQRATQFASAIGLVLSIAIAMAIYLAAAAKGEYSAPLASLVVSAVIGLMLTSIAMAVGDAVYCYRFPEPARSRGVLDAVSLAKMVQVGPGGDPLFMIPPDQSNQKPAKQVNPGKWKLTETLTWD